MESQGVSGVVDGEPDRGSWLVNVLVSVAIALVVAGAVVVTWVAIDRNASPGIHISGQRLTPPVVDISGAVVSPGVYELPADARLVDAVSAAGGLAGDADRTQLNLAARVGDGEKIVIPAIAVEPAQPGFGTPVASAGLININRAAPAQLELLPGIGPVLAARIVDERESRGPFLTVDDLTRVDGISESTVEELRPLVTVDG